MKLNRKQGIPRFSLRFLAIVLTTLTVVLGVFFSGARKYWRDVSVVEDLSARNAGLDIVFNFEDSGTQLPLQRTISSPPTNPVSIAYRNFSGRVKRVQIDTLTHENNQSLSKLSALKEAVVSDCSSLTDLTSVKDLPEFDELVLCKCINLVSTHGLENAKFHWLQIFDGKSLASFQGTGESKIERLGLANCNSMRSLAGIENLKNLRELTVEFASLLGDISDLEELPNLDQVSLDGCDHLTDITVLGRIHSLRYLGLNRLRQRIDLSILNGSNIEELSLSSCEWVTDLSSLSPCRSLKRLNLFQCNSLKLDSIARISQIEEVVVDLSSIQQPSIEFTRDLIDLKKLTLFITEEPDGIELISRLPNLKLLKIKAYLSDSSDFKLHLAELLRNSVSSELRIEINGHLIER